MEYKNQRGGLKTHLQRDRHVSSLQGIRQLEEGIACYKTLMSGMLDITDNIVGGEIIPPERVRRLDDDDPYLVVAADKGTATFSDIANGVARV